MKRSLATFVAAFLVNFLRPPLPPLPVPVPTRIVSWSYEQGNLGGTYRDVLEKSNNPDGPWADVPGPYSLNTLRNRYIVLVPAMKAKEFFRVRREYGIPNLIFLSVDKRK